ncbi:MAG: redoxin domain-containing protein [Methanotrichaceae archaeon]|nr:redoxin domain-containing protein [Methanotrichaceae archaeon]
MTVKIETGEKSKDFSLYDQNNQIFKFSEFLGKRVLLSFHPLAWTSVCAKQMKSLEDNRSTFESLNTIAVGISVDSIPCKKAWAESLAIMKTSILADFWPH